MFLFTFPIRIICHQQSPTLRSQTLAPPWSCQPFYNFTWQPGQGTHAQAAAKYSLSGFRDGAQHLPEAASKTRVSAKSEPCSSPGGWSGVDQALSAREHGDPQPWSHCTLRFPLPEMLIGVWPTQVKCDALLTTLMASLIKTTFAWIRV